MTTDHTSHERRGRRLAVRIVLFGLGVIALLTGVGTALATWSPSGAGTGVGTVGTLAAPSSVTVSPTFSTVTVNWSAVTPPTGTLAGYVVRRYQGASASNACGTNLALPATYIPTGTLTCTDTSVPNGSYTYTVTAVFRSWSTESSPSNVISVSGDPTFPSQTIAMTTATNAYLGGATIYYKGNSAGSFKLAATVSDTVSGPASANFPLVSTLGWTHPNETVTTGTGTNPKTYTSSSFSWTASPGNPPSITITGKDVAGNPVSTGLGFTSDVTGPTGGALTVNGVAAAGGATTSIARAAFPINVRTDYGTDAGSGLATSVLTRESATLTAGTCGTFGSSAIITGTPSQTGLTTATCYRYTLTGTDRVGNASAVSTIVKYDTTAPTQAITLSAATGASITGTNLYVHTTVAGSFVMNAAVTDNQTGPASVTFPVITTNRWTHPAQTVSVGTGSIPTISYPSSVFSWTAGAGRPGTYTVTATDLAGNTVATALTPVRDNTAPTGSALNVNGTGGTTAGSTSFNRTGAFAITRTDYTDAASGIASSILTLEQGTLSGNVCSAYGAPTTLTGAPAQSGLANRLLPLQADRHRQGRQHRKPYDDGEGRPRTTHWRCTHR